MKFIIRFQNSRLNQLWGSQRKAITLEAGTGKPFKYFWLFAVKTLQKWRIETRLHILNSGCLAAAAAAKSLQSCPTLCDPTDGSPPGHPCPWDSPGKNTGVGYHFLLQCMKVKRESEVAQSCLTLSNPMDCSLPGSSIHGIFQARVLEWIAISFSNTLVQFSHSVVSDSLRLHDLQHTRPPCPPPTPRVYSNSCASSR